MDVAARVMARNERVLDDAHAVEAIHAVIEVHGPRVEQPAARVEIKLLVGSEEKEGNNESPNEDRVEPKPQGARRARAKRQKTVGG